MALRVVVVGEGGAVAAMVEAGPDLLLAGTLSLPVDPGALRRLLPDVVLLDGGAALAPAEEARRLRLAAPAAAVVVLGGPPRARLLRGLMQAGVSDAVPSPSGPGVLAAALGGAHRRHREWLEGLAALGADALRGRGRTIAVFSTKGGTGKTTVATNLALALALESQQPVCLVDLDLGSGDAAAFLGLSPPVTIADYADARLAGEESPLERFLFPHPSGVRLLAAPVRPEQADTVLPEFVRQVIADCKERFHWVVIDLAPIFHDQTLAALDAADRVLLIMTPDLIAVRSARTALTTMSGLGYADPKVALVLNRDGQPDGLLPADVVSFFDRRLLLQLPDDPATVIAALNRGEPFVLSRPRSLLARQVRRLARLLIPGAAELEPETPFRWVCRRLGCTPGRPKEDRR